MFVEGRVCRGGRLVFSFWGVLVGILNFRAVIRYILRYFFWLVYLVFCVWLVVVIAWVCYRFFRFFFYGRDLKF